MGSNDLIKDGDSVLVRGLNWIGDAVMSLPALWMLRQGLPGSRITVIAPGWCADIYRLCHAVDAVIDIPHMHGLSSPGTEIRTAGRLKKDSFDAAIILPNSFKSAVTARIAGISTRIGYGTDGRGFMLSHSVPKPEADGRHTVLYYRELLAAIGIEWTCGQEKFGLAVDEEMCAAARAILAERGIPAGDLLIGFSPGAAWGPSKRWPAEHFSETARRLTEAEGRSAIFFGGPGDRELVDMILADAGGKSCSVAGAFDKLHHLVAAISMCRILVTNDSGPMHVAAALGVPVVVPFGPTDEKISGPWTAGEDKARILRAPGCRPCYNSQCKGIDGVPCLSRISPETVCAAAEELLALNRG